MIEVKIQCNKQPSKTDEEKRKKEKNINIETKKVK